VVQENAKKTSDNFNDLCGESSDVNNETIEEWVAKLLSVIEEYEPKNIANGEQTGLFFCALPKISPCLEDEKCSGGSLCKERLTVFCVLLCQMKWRNP
jgi:hypothetical protein